MKDLRPRQDVPLYELHEYERGRFARFIGSQDWHYFGTITSKHEMTLASARRVAFHLVRRVESGGNHSRGTSDGGLFWCAEPHKHASDGYHVHFLLRLPSRFRNVGRRTRWTFVLESARRAVGGKPWPSVTTGKLGLWHRVDVQDYRGQTAADYVAKYVTKDLSDWDYFRIF